MNRSVLAAVVGCAGLASAAFGQGTAVFVADSRWIITAVDAGATTPGADGSMVNGGANTPDVSVALPAGGATAILLTLQIRTRVTSGTFPTNGIVNGTNTRYGNFGPFQIGFGNAGATPSTITRTGNTAGTAFARGDWGSYQNGTTDDPETGDPIPTYTGMMRGASPGLYDASTFRFARGFRVFTNTDAMLNAATGNGPATGTGSGDNANGRFFGAINDLTDFNLLRDDFQSGSLQHTAFSTTNQNNNTSSGGTRTNAVPGDTVTNPWMSIYRVLLTSTTPLELGTGLDVNFNGFVLPASNEGQAGGNNWTLNGWTGGFVPTNTTISFGLVPTPGAAALMGLGGLLASRRRR